MTRRTSPTPSLKYWALRSMNVSPLANQLPRALETHGPQHVHAENQQTRRVDVRCHLFLDFRLPKNQRCCQEFLCFFSSNHHHRPLPCNPLSNGQDRYWCVSFPDYHEQSTDGNVETKTKAATKAAVTKTARPKKGTCVLFGICAFFLLSRLISS